MNILKWFEPKFDIKAFEEKWPVGSWYVTGASQVTRLSNIYIKDGKLKITIEYPVMDSNTKTFKIFKDDDLSPSFMKGRTKVNDEEAEKLEKSYWKTIEKELKDKTIASKESYNLFIEAGK